MVVKAKHKGLFWTRTRRLREGTFFVSYDFSHPLVRSYSAGHMWSKGNGNAVWVAHPDPETKSDVIEHHGGGPQWLLKGEEEINGKAIVIERITKFGGRKQEWNIVSQTPWWQKKEGRRGSAERE